MSLTISHAPESPLLLRPRPYHRRRSTIEAQHLATTTSSSSYRQRPSSVILLLTFITLFGISSSSSSSSNILPFVTGKPQQQQQQPQHSTLPVVGILSQPSKKHDHSYHYIAQSYVDWIEGGDGIIDGQQQAITIPIPYDASPELLDELFLQINGLLLPGGWNGYMPPSVPYLLDKIVESNNNGIYFPVWGTCLGYEFLIKYIGGIDAIQTGFDLYNTSIPLESVHIQELYNDPTIYETVTNLPVTLNNHQLGIEPNHFLSNPKLTAVWNITSINYDVNDRPFVSSIEPKYPLQFPFYGVQYHPEKNAYEYTTYPNTSIPYENIDHTLEGIEFSYYLSNFFLDKVRYGMQQQQRYRKQVTQNNHRFPSIRSYTSSIGIKYEEIYIIPYASHWMTTTSNNNNYTITTTTSATSSSQAIINISKTMGIIDFDDDDEDVSTATTNNNIIQYDNDKHQFTLLISSSGSNDDEGKEEVINRHRQKNNMISTSSSAAAASSLLMQQQASSS